MDIRVLGELVVDEAGAPINSVTPESRHVLALLVARSGQIVPTEMLVGELWGDSPPRHAREMIRTSVMQLQDLVTTTRRSRPEAPHMVLTDCPGGFRLDLSECSVDAQQYERTAGAGYRALDAGNWDVAARRLREALGLWRDEPYQGVSAGRHLDLHITRLRRSRERALRQWVEAELRQGRYWQLADDLAVLYTPESFVDQLVIQLRRCADWSQALESYRRLRRNMRAPTIAPSTARRTTLRLHDPQVGAGRAPARARSPRVP